MRSFKELYKLVIDNLENNPEYYSVCESIGNLYLKGNITYEEQSKLRIHFRENKPNENRYKEFYNHPSFQGNMYWWRLNKEGNEQRILFIKHLLNL